MALAEALRHSRSLKTAVNQTPTHPFNQLRRKLAFPIFLSSLSFHLIYIFLIFIIFYIIIFIILDDKRIYIYIFNWRSILTRSLHHDPLASVVKGTLYGHAVCDDRFMVSDLPQRKQFWDIRPTATNRLVANHLRYFIKGRGIHHDICTICSFLSLQNQIQLWLVYRNTTFQGHYYFIFDLLSSLGNKPTL